MEEVPTVSEIVQGLRTVFSADVSSFTRDVSVMEREMRGATRQAEALDREMKQIEHRSLRRLGSGSSEASILGREMMSEAAAIRALEEELAAPSTAGMSRIALEAEKARFELNKSWATSNIESLSGKAGQLADNLSMNVFALEEIQRAQRLAADGAAKADGRFDGLRKSVNSGLGPLKFFRENLGFIGVATFGVVGAIGALGEGIADLIAWLTRPEINAFAQSMLDSADASFKLSKELVRVAEKAREAIVPLAAVRKTVVGFEIENALAEGDFSKAAALQLGNERAVLRETIDAVSEARNEAMKRESDTRVALAKAEREKAKLDAEYQRIRKDVESIEKDRLQGFHPDYFGLKLAEGQNRAAATMNEAIIIGNQEIVGKLEQQIPLMSRQLDAMRKKDERLSRGEITLDEELVMPDLPHGGKVDIDARNARIILNTRLETDDPARFADVALKSAFLGIVAKPLTGAVTLGGAGIATGGRR